MAKRPFVGIFLLLALFSCISLARYREGEGDPLAIGEGEADGWVEGVVSDWEEKPNSTQIRLRDARFFFGLGDEGRLLGKVLLYVSKARDSGAQDFDAWDSGARDSDARDFDARDSDAWDSDARGPDAWDSGVSFGQGSDDSVLGAIRRDDSKDAGENAAWRGDAAESGEAPRVGNRIRARVTLERFSVPTNPGQYDERFYYESRGVRYKGYGEEIEVLDGSADRLRCLLRRARDAVGTALDAGLPEKDAKILRAMALGEKSGLAREWKEQYRQAGIGHLLAISGLHVSFIGMGVYEILKRLGSPKRLSCLAAIAFLWLYGIMAGFGISTQRAVLMLTLSLGAKIVGRTYDLASALAAAGCVILLENPLALFDCGFLLSFGAILGVGFLSPFLEERLGARGAVAKSLLSSLSVHVVTLPIVLFFYFEISPYGIFLNVAVLPLMSVLLALGLLGGVVGAALPSLPFLSRFFLGGAHWILAFYEWASGLAGRLPFGQVVVGKPEVWQILLYYAALAFLLVLLWGGGKEKRAYGRPAGRARGKAGGAAKTRGKFGSAAGAGSGEPGLAARRMGIRALFLAAALSLATLLVPMERWNRGGLAITFLDVGQGDSIFLRDGEGLSVLVDGGSSDVKNVGIYRILPFLKAKGVARLDYAVVTHSDSDHMSGVAELLEEMGRGGVAVGALVLAEAAPEDENRERLLSLAKEKGVPVLYAGAGDRIRDGALSVRFLHPAADFSFDPKDANGSSLVMEVEYGAFRALLTGDLGEEEEALLLEEGKWEDVDVLKVAHHGSRYSSSEAFLQAVRPELSVISCGEGNSYGHPHKEAVGRILASGSKILETRTGGAVTVRTDGTRIWAETYR